MIFRLDTFFLNSYRPYSEHPITNYPFRQWDDFHTSFDQRIEVWRNGLFMKVAFNMQILWGNLLKQCVDGLEESSVYIFFKMRNSLFSFRRDKVKPKQLRLPFSKKFLSNLIRHIISNSFPCATNICFSRFQVYATTKPSWCTNGLHYFAKRNETKRDQVR